MPAQKFTDIESKQLIRRGMTCTEIAKHLGVSKSTVSGRRKALDIAVSKNVVLR